MVNKIGQIVNAVFFRPFGLKLLRSKSGERQGPNIIKSRVDHPELIHKQAIVQFSELKNEVEVGPRSLLNKVLIDGRTQIGSNTTINGPGTEFYSFNNKITIGNFCSIARATAIQEFNHNLEMPTSYFIRYRVFNEPYGADIVSKGPIIIGNDVWIGTQSVILSGVKISDGAVIAANSVVTSKVSPYAIMAGTPAKVIGYRFEPQIIERLLELKWWDWPIEKIKKNHLFFTTVTTLESFESIV
jgi:virginiamycin A acetyltransferase